MGVKALLLEDLGANLEEQWANERSYTTQVMRGAKAESAFPDFIARKGRTLSAPGRTDGDPPATTSPR
jgi:hypothetical protein